MSAMVLNGSPWSPERTRPFRRMTVAPWAGDRTGGPGGTRTRLHPMTGFSTRKCGWIPARIRPGSRMPTANNAPEDAVDPTPPWHGAASSRSGSRLDPARWQAIAPAVVHH